jgi:hypothetical protein
MLAEAIVRRHGRRVLDGPFAGMEYAIAAVGSAYIPKLVGSYEAELHAVLASAIERGYRTIVDIGCAEGYYAVGLAVKLPSARIYAFDSDSRAQQLCHQMAHANRVVDRVEVSGECTPEQLARLPLEGALVICDVEGYEIELLCPEIAPALLTCDLLVELHDCFQRGITQTICARFRSSHDVVMIDSLPRDVRDYPAIHFLAADDQRVALSEMRRTQQWALLTRRAAGRLPADVASTEVAQS